MNTQMQISPRVSRAMARIALRDYNTAQIQVARQNAWNLIILVGGIGCIIAGAIVLTIS